MKNRTFLHKVRTKFDSFWFPFCQFFRYRKYKGKADQKVSIICNDCTGGVMYSCLGLQFLTPTINVWIEDEDFTLMCLHLKDFMSGNIIELKQNDKPYPIGILTPKSNEITPIKIHFMHDTFEEGVEKWERRKKRINWNDIVILGNACHTHECLHSSIETIVRGCGCECFFLTNEKNNPEKHTYQIKDNIKHGQVMSLTTRFGIFGTRYLETFNFPKIIFKCKK